MKKQEKIKAAYGRFYKPDIHHYSINGWVNLNEWTEDEVGKLIDEIGMEFREHSARPKSLQGIETNNGWIKIESEEDLPKENTEYYWTITENDKNIKERWFNKFFNEYEGEGKVTHYQPIEKPKPPLY